MKCWLKIRREDKILLDLRRGCMFVTTDADMECMIVDEVASWRTAREGVCVLVLCHAFLM